jgi:DUF1680 family protein
MEAATANRGQAAVVLINGVEATRSAEPGSYVELSRTWRSGDEVELRLTMEAAVQRAPAAPDIVAFTYGPLVLAGALGREGLEPGSDIVVNERKYGTYNDTPFDTPTLAGAPETIASHLRPGNRPLEFTTLSIEQRPVRLIPYHRIAHERYAIYWPTKSPSSKTTA